MNARHSPSLYETITTELLAVLKRGVVPWVKPWADGGGVSLLPYNARTGKRYHGVNVLILWHAALMKGYRSPAWIGYHQAQDLGGRVKKDEKSTSIVYGSTFVPKGERGKPEEEQNRVPFLKKRIVFNVEQTAGLPERISRLTERAPLPDALALVEAFLRAIGAKVLHGGNQAFYSPRFDLITLPEPGRFESAAHYYATSLHEHAHWSGHKSRLNRDLSGRFGTERYAAEELVAELAAAFLAARLAIPGRLRHAEYLGHWITLLSGDSRALFTAASKATEAAEYLEEQGGLAPEAETGKTGDEEESEA